MRISRIGICCYATRSSAGVSASRYLFLHRKLCPVKNWTPGVAEDVVYTTRRRRSIS